MRRALVQSARCRRLRCIRAPDTPRPEQYARGVKADGERRAQQGRPRVKFTHIDEMLEALGTTP